MIGRTLGGSYKLLDTVGAGSFASVYVARDLRSNVVVAVKVLHPQHVLDSGILERFRREADLVQRLQHPNIVRALDFGRDGDVVYLVQEYVQGHTLAEVIQARGQLDVAEALGAMRQALEALDAASHMGVVHRDVKPHNMMLTPEGALKVMDFGVARQAELGTMTQSGVFMGTLHYMAPEVLQGERADIRSDLYALGITLYQCLAGKVPFDADSAWALITLHVTAAPPPLAETRADLPAGLVAVVEKALTKQPAERFQTPREMLDALAPFAAGALPAPGVLPTLPAEQPASPAGRSQTQPGEAAPAPPGEQLAMHAEQPETQPSTRPPPPAAPPGELTEQSGGAVAAVGPAVVELTKPPTAGAEAAPTRPGAARCANCGEPLGGAGRFCATCGHAVGSRGDPAPATAEAREGRGAPAILVPSTWPRKLPPQVLLAAAGGLVAIALLALFVVRPLVRESRGTTGTRELSTVAPRPSLSVAVPAVASEAPSATPGPTATLTALPPATLFALAVLSAGGSPVALVTPEPVETTDEEPSLPTIVEELATESELYIATLEADVEYAETPEEVATRVAEVRTETALQIATLEAEAMAESTPDATNGWEVLPIGGLTRPGDIVADSPERGQALYIADTENHRILQLLDTFIAGEWGSQGFGSGEFNLPVGLGLDAEGNLYVADHENDRLAKWDITGHEVTLFGSQPDSGEEGSFNGPSDVAVDDEGNLYVADSYNDRIQILSPSGAVLHISGGSGDAPGEFDWPSGIAVDQVRFAVYVADSGNHRIQKLDAQGGSPEIIGSEGNGPGEFDTPARVAIDSYGNLYVAEVGNDRIQKLAPDGTPLAMWGATGDGPGEFEDPVGVAFDADGNLYVADAGNHRIQRLSREALEQAEPPSPSATSEP